MAPWILLYILVVSLVKGQLSIQFDASRWQLEMEGKSWWEAKSFCEANYASLISLRDPGKAKKLFHYIGFNEIKTLWVGATYINGKVEWLDGPQTGAVELKDQTRTSLAGNCITFVPEEALSVSGIMRRNCAVKYPFLCEQELCPESHLSHGGRCYRLHQVPRFEDVRGVCNSLGEDYVLASVTSDRINEFVATLGQEKTIFISPYYSMTHLVHSDQTPINFTNFIGSSDPSIMSECVSLNTTTGFWKYQSCFPIEESLILCEYRMKAFYQKFVQKSGIQQSIR